jgi:hypothetical protein
MLQQKQNKQDGNLNNSSNKYIKLNLKKGAMMAPFLYTINEE